MAVLSPAEAAEAKAELSRRARARCWCPHKPTSRQQAFLALPQLEAFYGGQAGGGKSDALLMDQLRFADTPGFSGILFRRTYQDLALPGSLMARSHEWLDGTDAHWNGTDKQWRFPSGATIVFGYLDREQDKLRYKSAEFQRIAFDELTQLLETQYRYLMSRLRRTVGVDVPLGVRSASNPGDRGHDWVKEYFVEPGDPGRPFVPASLDDNPFLDRVEYRKSLARLDALTYQQLAEGVWVRDSGGLIYPYRSSNIIQALPKLDKRLEWGLGVDLGSSETKPTTAFVIGAWHPKLPGFWAVQAECHAGMIPSSIAEHIRLLEDTVGGFEVIAMDEGALGKGYANEFRERWHIPIETAEKHNKLGFRKLLGGDLERDYLQIVEPQCEPLLDEMSTLTWNAAGTDNEKQACNHCTDALLYLWRAARTHLGTAPDTVLSEGTDEWAKAEADRMEALDDQEMAGDSRQPAWAKW